MKKFLSIMLAILMVVTTIPMAFAADETTYTSGDYSYTLNEDGKAVICGYSGTETDLVIPARIDEYDVFAIEKYTFQRNDIIRTVVISEGIEQIGGGAFGYCDSLESIIIPDSVTALGVDCNFGSIRYCPKLEYVSIGKGLYEFAGYEILECPALKEIVFSEENPYYAAEDLVVYSKNKKTLVNFLDYSAESFTVPDGVRVIGSEAFNGTDIKEINFNDDLLYIAYFAFCGCDNLTEVVFPNSVNEFGRFIFKTSDSLADVTLPEGAVNISDGMFDECFKLKNIYVPAGTQTVAQEAFYNWTYDLYDYKVIPEFNFYFGGSEAEWEALNVDTLDTVPNGYYNHTHEYDCTETLSECAECGLTYSNSHVWKITEVVYPENGVDGYIDLVCSTDASHTKREVLSADTPLVENFYNSIEELRKFYLDTDWIDSFKEMLLEEYAMMVSELTEFIYGEHYANAMHLQQYAEDIKEFEGLEEYIKPDYSEYDALISELEEAAADVELFDTVKSSVDSIKAAVEEIRANGENSAYEYQATVDAYADEVETIIAGIKDGTLVKVDGIAILIEYNNECAESLIEKYGEENYNSLMNSTTDEVVAEATAIEKEAMALTGTVAENAEKIAELKERLKALFDAAELCLAGTHSFMNYTETSSAKCEVNAKETGTCWFCGETDEREVEGTALSHSFTKYEVTEEAKCGVAGKEVAYCDHGCQTTDEKEIPALEHIDNNGDYICDYGCGHEFPKPVEPEQPDTPDTPDEPTDEACDHLCHKDGILGFLWKIINFFYRLFNIQQYCDCGEIHYDAPVFG